MLLCGWVPPNLSNNGCIVTCNSCKAVRGQKDGSESGTTLTKNFMKLYLIVAPMYKHMKP